MFELSLHVTVARFDFSWGDPDYHQETLENLKMAVKSTKKLCAVSQKIVNCNFLLKPKKKKSLKL